MAASPVQRGPDSHLHGAMGASVHFVDLHNPPRTVGALCECSNTASVEVHDVKQDATRRDEGGALTPAGERETASA